MPSKLIQYNVGNLFEMLPSKSNTPTIIGHIVNNIGAWGSGFVIPLGRKFPLAKSQYEMWSQNQDPNLAFELGNCQIVNVEEGVYVANMCAQEGIMNPANHVPIRYEALCKSLRTVADFCQRAFDCKVNVHSPAFGSERAGGKWSVIEPLIEEILGPISNELHIYTLTEQEKANLFDKS